MSRRLPVYLVLDASAFMSGGPIAAVGNGVDSLVSSLRRDPRALESAWLSVITFSNDAKQLAPLTELAAFRTPALNASGGADLGAALKLVAQKVDTEVSGTTGDRKGDWRPLVFIVTGGAPDRDWKKGLAAFKQQQFGMVVACAAGPGADISTLQQITENVVRLDAADSAGIRAFFKWVSDITKDACGRGPVYDSGSKPVLQDKADAMNRILRIVTFPVWGPVKLVLWIFRWIAKSIAWIVKQFIVFLFKILPTILVFFGLGLATGSDGDADVLNIGISMFLAGIALQFVYGAWRTIRRPGRGGTRAPASAPASAPAGAAGGHPRSSGIGKAIRWIVTAPFRLVLLLVRLPFMPVAALWATIRGPRRFFLAKTIISALAFVGLLFGLAFIKYVVVDRPRFAERLYKYDTYRALVIMDRNGRLLGVFGKRQRIYTPIENIPEMLQHAFISAEDKRFESHFGLDPVGMASAVPYNVKRMISGGRLRGASTITQQVVKQYLLNTRDGESTMQKLSRKMTEPFAAIELERRFGKKKILEVYLNEIYLGMGSYGVVAAAECYFNKSLHELTIDEMAMLGGLPQLPGRNPHNRKVDIGRVKERRNYVIGRMEKNGYISPAEADAARNADINNVNFNPLNQDENKALDEYVVDELHRLGYTKEQVKGSGFKVYLTIDLKAQRAAMTALKHGVEQVRKRRGGNAPQAALVAIDGKGDIIAMVGGLGSRDEKGNYRKNELNRAIALRQPGSTMKPIVYAAALERGAIGPDDTLDASPLVVGGRSINDHCASRLSVREAIAQSSNRAVIRVYQRAGGNAVINLARKMGVETPMQDHPLLSLGVAETRLLDMTNAYVPFFNQGFTRGRPRIIFKVRDEQEQWREHERGRAARVMSASTANLVRGALRDAVVSEKGTAKAARGIPGAAGKTGTTTANRDALFIGAAPTRRFGEAVVGVWVGFDDNTPLGPGGTESGGITSAPVWAEFFSKIRR